MRRGFKDPNKRPQALDVYLACVPDDVEYKTLHPKERDTEVCSVKNDEVKKHKYCAWRLLEYALEHTFGYDIKKLDLTKTLCGKWICPSCEFSISHSGKIVAVALSRNPVGVDVQVEKTIVSSTFAQRMLTEKEQEALVSLDNDKERSEELLRLWTKKESIFKSLNSDRYIPAEIETSEYNAYEEALEMGGEKYYLSVSGADVSKIRIFKDVIL